MILKPERKIAAGIPGSGFGARAGKRMDVTLSFEHERPWP